MIMNVFPSQPPMLCTSPTRGQDGGLYNNCGQSVCAPQGPLWEGVTVRTFRCTRRAACVRCKYSPKALQVGRATKTRKPRAQPYAPPPPCPFPPKGGGGVIWPMNKNNK